MNETPLVLLMGGNNGENFIVYSATHIHLYIVWVFILTTQIQNKNTVVIIPFSQVKIHNKLDSDSVSDMIPFFNNPTIVFFSVSFLRSVVRSPF